MLRHRVGTGYNGLARDDRGQCGQADHRNESPCRIKLEERAFERLWLSQQQGALPQIVQRQGRKDEDEPGCPDRVAAKMPEVGVERFRSCHREEYGAQCDQPGDAMRRQKVDTVNRIEREKDLWLLRDIGEATNRQRKKPDHDDGPEPGCNTCRTA